MDHFRTRVRFPPPPPIENPTAFAVGFFLPEWSVLARFHSALPWGVDDDFDQFWAEAGLVTRHEQ